MFDQCRATNSGLEWDVNNMRTVPKSDYLQSGNPKGTPSRHLMEKILRRYFVEDATKGDEREDNTPLSVWGSYQDNLRY